MASSCYILYSKRLNTFYVGATHETVEQRLDKHNNHQYGNHRFTAKTNDWEIFLVIKTNNCPHAVIKENLH